MHSSAFIFPAVFEYLCNVDIHIRKYVQYICVYQNLGLCWHIFCLFAQFEKDPILHAMRKAEDEWEEKLALESVCPASMYFR